MSGSERCHGCGWRYAGSLAESKASDHAPGCPNYALVQERIARETARKAAEAKA